MKRSQQNWIAWCCSPAAALCLMLRQCCRRAAVCIVPFVLILLFAGFAGSRIAGGVLGIPAADAQEPVPAKTPEKSAPAETEPASPDPSADFVDLLAQELTQSWKCYHSDSAVPLESVWKIVLDGPEKERILICTGQPKGFLYTTETYTDFELQLQWKFPDDANGNSGVLVYTQAEEKIWPTAMQIQFHQPKAGSVFPSGDAKSDNKTDKNDLAHPINTWNDCRVVSRGGRLTVEINGVNAGETTGSVPASGRIALQSEGAIVHFRRLKIRRLASADDRTPGAPENAGPETPAPATP